MDTIHRGNPVRGTVKYAVNVWICAEDVGDRGVALDLEKLRVKYGIRVACAACAGRVVVVFLFVVVEQQRRRRRAGGGDGLEAPDPNGVMFILLRS